MLFFVILIVLVCVILGGIILIQNPKGGGLASNVGGFSNQLMGVKQTTDVLEKGTWFMAVVLALLCLLSAFFIPKPGAVNNAAHPEKVTPGQVIPQGQQPQPAAPNR
jgi:preprotein translocase subunit SecG